ncbi:hypothetical protein NLU13_8491 [Sarocladium strictum]|uniref:Prokaryotic-type class I peptide chain release factors domain-containing protein n=1 Tax=Sarocladium strictum TaxID=5046 RepID=A0AA39GCF9_SARSR|nr:hypothetical protein NLU13_8491 [Sarocladium strictum]
MLFRQRQDGLYGSVEMLRTLIRRPICRPSGSLIIGPGLVPQIRSKRYEAFGSDMDQEAVAEARSWYQKFDTSLLPKGTTTFARSSGPGGQHVNKTETKAITMYPCKDLLALLPKHLHPAVRQSKYYTAGSDSWTFQAQEHRSRTANVDENRRKLTAEVMRIYHEMTPNETSSEKRKKHREIEERFHETRMKQKKMASAKKQSRRGPVD